MNRLPQVFWHRLADFRFHAGNRSDSSMVIAAALQRVPDWRWLTARPDSPWYPTTRLFRQTTAGDWAEVFERIGAELATTVL